ncbi:alpha-mannosidase [Dehalogenimonas alkenigignens]|uniref:Alpha-mannosidase n=1 Tax=Dehalogenimonas alkenigignens TaxID=1217799 RepID=A0A0W0GJT0_9CHLR|nr:glycoside hydrolase family 38 C-terminal domain-containing protein [Dehalogenimonas alkenigignens]KTB48827.1 Alpha-mannosidase [Dehalogenimonas alkenigignens]PVV84766.1 glycoside hydrolase [Dehalogenimonas alkenigignens]
MDTVYLVPHSHYDAVWAFTKEDYFFINIEKILKPAIEMMADPGYRFLIEQTALIEEIERRNPSLFEDIKRAAQKGQIEFAPGEHLMSDTMLPLGETLVRQIQVGKTFIRDKFGTKTLVAWGADSFGYNAQMPQIYLKSGYRYFAFRRGADRESPSEFWWQGLDGSRILTHWMPLGYRAGLYLDELDDAVTKLKSAAATGNILMPSGSGSIPPQPETMRMVRRWNRSHKGIRMVVAKSVDFFRALEKSVPLQLETRQGELYSGKYSRVFPHCTSSRIWLKQNLRHYEHMILACEKWLALGWLLGMAYPADELNDNWLKVLWGAFHDVAPGTGMDDAYEEVKHNFGYLQSHLAQILSGFIEMVQGNLAESADILVLNAHSWEVRNWVEAELGFDPGEVKRIGGLGSGSDEIGVEILESTRYSDDSFHTVKIGFIASVPPFGFRTYRLLRHSPRSTPASSDGHRLITKGNCVQNKYFRLEVDPGSGLLDVFIDGKHLLRGNELVIEEETGDLYYHRQNFQGEYRTESEAGVTFGKFRLKHFEIQKTKLRRVIKLESDYYSLIWPYRLQEKLRPVLWRHSYLSVSKTITVYHDLPRIDCVTRVDNRHPQIQLRLKFATDIRSPEYTSEIQFGALSRPTDQALAPAEGDWVEKPSGIYPALNWVDYSDKEYGITLINQGLPSHEIKNGAIYLTLLRSILMLSSDGATGPAVPTPDAQEFKQHVFEYSLYPHKGDWRDAQSYLQGFEVNSNLQAFQIRPEKADGSLFSDSFSFINIAPSSIILAACKRAEDGSGIVLRLYETRGQATEAAIQFFNKVNAGAEPPGRLFPQPSQVWKVNLLEEKESEVAIVEGAVTISFTPFEILTLKVVFQ